MSPRPIPPGPLVPAFVFGLAALGFACFLALCLSGCSPENAKKVRAALEAVDAKTIPQRLCVAAHAVDGQWEDAEVIARFCRGPELAWWTEEASRIYEHVQAQRGGAEQPVGPK